MRRLILLRHARAASPPQVGDEARPLDASGYAEAATIGSYISANSLPPDLALISPSRRTRETWEHCAIAPAPAFRLEPRLYSAPAEMLFMIVRETPPTAQSLLLVGHNPGFEELARALIVSGETEALARFAGKIPPAGLAVIALAIDDWKGLQPQTGRLEQFVTPKSLGKA